VNRALVTEGLFHARARLFPWTLPRKVRVGLAITGGVWYLLHVFAAGVVVTAMTNHLEPEPGWADVGALAFNFVVAIGLMLLLPTRACKHCGRTSKDPVEGGDHL
jgi:DMSO/TMAO reductase YedYZ heme-binding membrane subunit